MVKRLYSLLMKEKILVGMSGGVGVVDRHGLTVKLDCAMITRLG